MTCFPEIIMSQNVWCLELVCCFFGHRDTPSTVKADLIECITNLIENEGADSFLVGHQGAFDAIVLSVLRGLKAKYPHITYNVVLAYMPGPTEEYTYAEPMETMYPEGLESAPKKFAISWRNDWMLKNSDCCIAYVKHHFGGSGKFVEKAERQGKRIINLASTNITE